MTTPQSVTNDTINAWADDSAGPIALILKQKLLPVDGEGGIIFPPTYADIGYSIDELSDGTKVAQVDSVGSQANRMEPVFKLDKHKNLVPQIEFVLGKDADGQERRTTIFDLAHRAGDAVVRSSDLAKEIDGAFKDLLRKHDATALAKLAPTSLVFGAWDSRGTQAKRPRLVRSIIRAENVDVLHSAAQYNSVWKLLSDGDKEALEKEAKAKKADLAVKGFKDVPATFRKTDKIPKFRDGRPNDDARVLGGVIAKGPIYRQTTINLIALRSLNGADGEATKKLRHYLLGLALVAATADMELYLREGCLLRYAEANEEPWEVVLRRGKSDFITLADGVVSKYAEAAAKIFVVEQPAKNKSYEFDIKKAKALLAKKEDDVGQATE